MLLRAEPVRPPAARQHTGGPRPASTHSSQRQAPRLPGLACLAIVVTARGSYHHYNVPDNVRRSVRQEGESFCWLRQCIKKIRRIDGPGRPVVRGFRRQGPGVGWGAGPWRGSGSSGRRPADPFVGPGLPEADRCDLVPRVAGAFGHCENSVRQARSARRGARAASLSRCPAGSPPRALPAGYGSTLFPGSAGLISAARAWIRGAPRRRSRVPTGRRRPRWYASSTLRCA